MVASHGLWEPPAGPPPSLQGPEQPPRWCQPLTGIDSGILWGALVSLDSCSEASVFVFIPSQTSVASHTQVLGVIVVFSLGHASRAGDEDQVPSVMKPSSPAPCPGSTLPSSSAPWGGELGRFEGGKVEDCGSSEPGVHSQV